MIGPVNGLTPLQATSTTGPAARVAPVEGERSFKEILQTSIEDVNRLQEEAINSNSSGSGRSLTRLCDSAVSL